MKVISIDTRNEVVLTNDYYKVPNDTLNFHIAFMNLNFVGVLMYTLFGYYCDCI